MHGQNVERMYGQASDAIDPQSSIGEALTRLRGTLQSSLPVIDSTTGEIVGVLTRSPAAIDSVFSAPAPLRLGGMATPLGVYLTDGVYSGGAGFWGLVLTGMALCGLALVAQAMTLHLLAAMPGIFSGHLLTKAILLPAWVAQIVSALGPTWMTLLLLYAILRLMPMSGTHAAEHQVVHCVERHLPLIPDWVRTMPRVHPRCGTNLVIGFSLFQLLFIGAFSAAQAAALPSADAASLALLLAAPVTLIYWRRLGGWMQQWFATKPATEAQIAGAIHAAETVLAYHSACPEPPARFRGLRRIWTMGLAQVMLGYCAVFMPLLLAARHWHWLGRVLEI